MTPRLTDDQRQAIERTGGKPVDVLDASNNAHYVLLSADLFEKVRPIFEPDDATDPREAYPLVDAVMAADDADDPTLAHYQRYGRREP